MARWSVLAMACVVLASSALIGRAAVPHDPQQPADGKPDAVEQKIGNFQMSRVMREYKWAAKHFKPLEDRHTRMTTNLIAWRKQCAEICQEVTFYCDSHTPYSGDRTKELFTLARKIAVEHKKVRALLTDATALLAAEVHDHIRAEVAALAKERELIALVAYPVTPEYLLSPEIKQLKLKPPTQPFYLHPLIDCTDELIQRLNAKFEGKGASPQKIGYFQMPRVLRDCRQAEHNTKVLHEELIRLSTNLIEWRGRYIQITQELQRGNPAMQEDPRVKELLTLAHKIEVEDRKVNAALEEESEKLKLALRQKLRAAVAEMAKERGLVAVVAYPEDEQVVQVAKFFEMKVKVDLAAAQPFYLDPSVDYTDELIKQLNAKFAADGGKE